MKPLWWVLGLTLLLAGLVPLVLSVIERGRGNRVRANLLEPVGLLLMALGLLLVTVFVLMIRGWFWTLEVPFVLVTGWARYLWRVLPRTESDPVAVGSALACAAAAAAGAHLFLRWLASAGGRAWRWKRTLQLLLLVAILFASGLAVVGLVQQTGWLIRTPEPLVKDNRLIS